MEEHFGKLSLDSIGKLTCVQLSKDVLQETNNLFVFLDDDSSFDIEVFLRNYEILDGELRKYQYLKKRNVFGGRKTVQELIDIIVRVNELTQWPVHLLTKEFQWIYSAGKIEDIRKFRLKTGKLVQILDLQDFPLNLVAGKYGCGKTELAKFLAERLLDCVYVDMRFFGDFSKLGVRVVILDHFEVSKGSVDFVVGLLRSGVRVWIFCDVYSQGKIESRLGVLAWILDGNYNPLFRYISSKIQTNGLTDVQILMGYLQASLKDNFEDCTKLALKCFFTDEFIDHFRKLKKFGDLQNVSIDGEILLGITKSGQPIFKHKLYSAVLCAKCLFDHAKNLENYQILFRRELLQVRYFFDRLAAEDSPLMTKILLNELPDSWEDLSRVDVFGRTILHISSTYGHNFDLYPIGKDIWLKNPSEHIQIDWSNSGFMDYKKLFNLKNIEEEEPFFIVDPVLYQKILEQSNSTTIKESIQYAFLSGSIDHLDLLLKEKPSDFKLPLPTILFYHSAKNNFANLLNCLLEQNLRDASILYNKEDLMTIAVKNQSHLVLKKLSQTGLFDINELNLLHIVCRQNLNKMIAPLLNIGCDINYQNYCEETPLITACKNANSSIIKNLIAQNANTSIKDQHNRNCLFYALTSKTSDEAIEAIINTGIDINEADITGITPLMLVCQNYTKKMFDFLINKKAQLNEVHHMVLYAAQNRFDDHLIIATLLKNGLPTAEDKITPLMLACQSVNRKIVKTLLENGAQVNARDSNGENALFYLLKQEKLKPQTKEIVEDLMNFGLEITEDDGALLDLIVGDFLIKIFENYPVFYYTDWLKK